MTQHTAEATKQQLQTRTPAGKLIWTSGGFVWHIEDEEKTSYKETEESENLFTWGTVRRSDGITTHSFGSAERDGAQGFVGDEQLQEAFWPVSESRPHMPESRWRRDESGIQTNDYHPRAESERTETGDVRFHVVSPGIRRRAGARQKSSVFGRRVPVWTMIMERVGKAAKRFEAVPTTWADHFQRGAVAGLVLGCLSLVLFHQVTLPAATAAFSGQVDNASPTATPVLAPNTPFQVTLPSAKVYIMETGPYPTVAAADAAQKQLGQAGVATQLVQNVNGVTLWANAALTRRDAIKAPVKLRASSSTGKSSVQLVSWAAEASPTTAVDTSAAADAANQWLAAIVTALRVETGAAAGETATRDVFQAVQNASHQKPADSTWSAGSVPTALGALYNHVTAASTLLSKNQPQQAESEILKAWAELYAAHQQALGNN